MNDLTATSVITCKKCHKEILGDTRSRVVFCACGTVAVDGNQYYVRILGNPEDYWVSGEEKGEHQKPTQKISDTP